MLKKFLQEETDRTYRESQKRNQEIHKRLVEKAKRKELYEDSKIHQRFPNEFNQGYSYKK